MLSQLRGASSSMVSVHSAPFYFSSKYRSHTRQNEHSTLNPIVKPLALCTTKLRTLAKRFRSATSTNKHLIHTRTDLNFVYVLFRHYINVPFDSSGFRVLLVSAALSNQTISMSFLVKESNLFFCKLFSSFYGVFATSP